MALIKQMVSSKTNEWYTPQKLYDYLDSQFHFTLDPCCTHENTKCKKHYTLEDDGLSKDWDNEVVFMNPPYGGHTIDWLKKAELQRHKGTTTVCLIVSATDRSYWHDIIFNADEVWFLRGRVKFGGQKTTAPFASAIVIFKPDSESDYTETKIRFVDLREYHQKI